MRLPKILTGIILFTLFCEYTYAVPPPDFIIQAASQLVSFFTIWVVLLSGIYATGIQFLKAYYIEHKKLILILWIPSIFILAGIWAYYMNIYYQWIKQAKYNQSWIEESQKNKQDSPIWEQTQKTTPQSIRWEIDTNSWVNTPTRFEVTPVISEVETWTVSLVSPISTWLLVPIASLSWWEIHNIDTEFFEKNKNIDLKISNEEFKKSIVWNNQDYIILDAREDMEYEIGHIPNSIHVRFADIKEWKWSEITKDKYIIVVCWSGMRGKEVAEYLREKNIVSRYLENWVNGWVESKWDWQWEVKFSKIYGKINYSTIYSTEQVRSMKWIVFIDSRSPDKYSHKHISWAINIPLLSTPSDMIDTVFSKITKGTRIIVICDEYINCFDAKLTGIELEKRWVIFLGRYNKPWEY